MQIILLDSSVRDPRRRHVRL